MDQTSGTGKNTACFVRRNEEWSDILWYIVAYIIPCFGQHITLHHDIVHLKSHSYKTHVWYDMEGFRVIRYIYKYFSYIKISSEDKAC